MHVFAVPVSGGYFPMQLALMLELRRSGVDADLLLGCSGGNLAAYVYLAADGCPYAVERIAARLSSRAFLRSWWPGGLVPSWPFGILQGAMYQRGAACKAMFKELFTPVTVCRVEAWTCAVHRPSMRASLFCNRRRRESALPLREGELHQRGCLSPVYAGGDVDLLADAALASASVPTLVPPYPVAGVAHYDGGLLFASPLSPLKPALDRLPARGGLHVDYVNSFDLDSVCDVQRPYLTNIVETAREATQALIYASCLADRDAALDLLRYTGRPLVYAEGRGSAETLRRLAPLRERAERSVLELYPGPCIRPLGLAEVDGASISRLIAETTGEYYYRLWRV